MRLERTGFSSPGHQKCLGAAKTKIKHQQGNLPGRPTAVELERRKAMVMAVATDLFVGRGFAATSLVDIARGAGVATRTLYEHFGDKEAIFRDVIIAREAGVALQPPTVEVGDTMFSALQRAGQYAYQLTYREQSIGLMRLMIAERNRFPDFIHSAVSSIFTRFHHNIAKVFEGLQSVGLNPAGDHARSAELFADLVLGSQPIMTYTNWKTSSPSEADLDERIDLFILGRFGRAVARTARTRKAKSDVAPSFHPAGVRVRP